MKTAIQKRAEANFRKWVQADASGDKDSARKIARRLKRQGWELHRKKLKAGRFEYSMTPSLPKKIYDALRFSAGIDD